MAKFIRPVLLGLLAFIAWIGATYIATSAILSAANREAAENWGFALWLLSMVGSLLVAGAVAAWFAPLLWRKSSAIVGAISTILLFLVTSYSGAIWAFVLIFLACVSVSIVAGAVVNYFLNWVKADMK